VNFASAVQPFGRFKRSRTNQPGPTFPRSPGITLETNNFNLSTATARANPITPPSPPRQQRVYSSAATPWPEVLCPIARLKVASEAQGRISESSVTETSERPPPSSNWALAAGLKEADRKLGQLRANILSTYRGQSPDAKRRVLSSSIPTLACDKGL